MGCINESEFERRLDRRVEARLYHDRAYLFAENAEEQAEREAVIEQEEYDRLVEAVGYPYDPYEDGPNDYDAWDEPRHIREGWPE